MQPASDAPGGGGSSSFRRWGPIAAIVVVVAIIVGVVALGGGDDDDEAATTDTTAAPDDTADTDAPAEAGQFPMSFRDAEEAGIVDDIDWGDRCDTERGQVAIPSYYAAECYAPWDGSDNGGATERGVTADAINIVIYQGPESDPILNYITDAISNDDTNEDVRETVYDWFDMLQTYYETYGRTINVQYYQSEGIASDAAVARADAVKIAEEMDPFIVLGAPSLTDAFGEELNARGIMCYSCGGGTREQILNNRAPLYFGGGLDNEQSRAHNVEVLVNQVAGRPAEFAGDPAYQDQERIFGYLYIESGEDSATSAQAYRDALAERGVELAEMVPYVLDPATLQETAANSITRLKSAGVTTVIFAGDPVAPRDFTNEATAQNYHPEWFLNLSVLIDTNVFGRSYDQDQWEHAFGISALSTRVDAEAFGEITGRKIYEWFTGEEPPAIDTIGVLVPAPNWVMGMIQATGPDLTYENFHDAVMAWGEIRTGVLSPTSSWGDHGYWDRLEGLDYEGIDDVTKIWWDPDDVAADEVQTVGPGVWQFVDGGERYFVDEWAEGEFKAFDPDGAVGVLDEAPADEAPPTGYEPLPVTNPVTRA